MIILEIIIIVLLIRMIMNQHTLDEHIDDVSRGFQKSSDDYINSEGFINSIIFKINVIFNNVIYYLKNKFRKDESEK